MAKQKKSKKEIKENLSKKTFSIYKEFKAFISKGNAIQMAIGVILAGAFSAIVTAITAVFTSITSWPLSGGLVGLVTILPPMPGSKQAGIGRLGQSFAASDKGMQEAVYNYAKTVLGIDKAAANEQFLDIQKAIQSSYTQYGDRYIYNGAARIDWGSIINAVITFFIIAIILFIILKIVSSIMKKKEALEAKATEELYKRHPELKPVENNGPKEPTDHELLKAILEELKTQNQPKQ